MSANLPILQVAKLGRYKYIIRKEQGFPACHQNMTGAASEERQAPDKDGMANPTFIPKD